MQRRVFLGGLCALAARGASTWFDSACGDIEATVRDAKVRAASIWVRRGSEEWQRVFGEAKSPDTPFLIASITKPMTVAAVMKLVESGRVLLDDPVSKHLTECRHPIIVRQLLTHTSGLPDMLPNNVELRRRQAPLADFVREAVKAPLAFTPGTRCSYSSMGILLASEIAQRVTGTPFPAYLAETVFAPLGMKRTALGLGHLKVNETAQCQVEQAEAQYGGDPTAKQWDWNSPYWRHLGVPWGGAHASAADIGRFLWEFLHPTGRVLNERTCRAMVVNQNLGLNQPYGFGWSVRPSGRGLSARAFGHGGSTGTLCWADPAKDAAFVLLTTLPARVSNKLILEPVSDRVSEAV